MAAAALLVVLSSVAFVLTLSLSPDPERGGNLWQSIRSIPPKARAWCAAGLFFFWLFWVVNLPDTGLARFVALYLVAAGVTAALSYESENAFRSRKGLPPKPPPMLPWGRAENRPGESGTEREPKGLLTERVWTAVAVHVAATLGLAVSVFSQDTWVGGSWIPVVVAVPILAALFVAALSATWWLSPDPRRTWSLLRPCGAVHPFQAAGIWGAAVVVAAVTWTLIEDRMRGGVCDNWAHTLFGWIGWRVLFYQTWICGEVLLLYLAVTGAVAYRRFESVERFQRRSAGRSPDRDEIGRLLAAYEAGHLDRDELAAELRRRPATTPAPDRPHLTIDPD